MKKMVLSIALIVLFYKTFAQDYYTTISTPTGISIEAINRDEFSADELAYIEASAADWIDDHNSNAIRVGPASRTYNCHNFAWHNSDGGTKVWVNQFDYYSNVNLAKYWSGTSPTYQQTNILKATKAFYPVWPEGDHSAKVISLSLFESKWGAWPRYQHSPTDCPYNSSNILYYYVPISGDNLICTSKNYSTINISTGTYNWTGSNVSITGNGSSVTATKISNGSGWIKTEISSPYSGTTILTEKKTIWVGTPPYFDISGPGTITLHNTEHYWIYDGSSQFSTYGITSYDWTITNNLQFESSHLYQIDVYIKGITLGRGTIRFLTTNSCGTSTFSLPVRVASGGALKVFPNPASNEIKLLIDDEIIDDISGIEKSTDTEYLVTVYNNYGVPMFTRKYSSTDITINISGWQKSIYYINLTIGDEEYSASFVIE